MVSFRCQGMNHRYAIKLSSFSRLKKKNVSLNMYPKILKTICWLYTRKPWHYSMAKPIPWLMKLGSKHYLLDNPQHAEIQTDCLKVCTINYYLLDAVVCKWLS